MKLSDSLGRFSYVIRRVKPPIFNPVAMRVFRFTALGSFSLAVAESSSPLSAQE